MFNNYNSGYSGKSNGASRHQYSSGNKNKDDLNQTQSSQNDNTKENREKQILKTLNTELKKDDDKTSTLPTLTPTQKPKQETPSPTTLYESMEVKKTEQTISKEVKKQNDNKSVASKGASVDLASEVREIKDCLKGFVDVVKSFKDSFEELALGFLEVKDEIKGIKSDIKSDFDAQNRKIEGIITSNNTLSVAIKTDLAKAIKEDLVSSLNNAIRELKQTNSRLADEYKNRFVDLEKANKELIKANDTYAKAVNSIEQLTNSEKELKNDKKNLEKEINDLQDEKERIQKNADRDKKQAEDYRNKTVVKITELQEKLDTANQKLQDKEQEYNNYVTTTEEERARERILQQQALNQKEAEYKEDLRKQEKTNKDLTRQLQEAEDSHKKAIEELESKAKREKEELNESKIKELTEAKDKLTLKAKERIEQVKKELSQKYTDFEELHTCYEALSEDVKRDCKSYFGDGNSVASIIFKVATRDNIEYLWQYIADRIKEDKLPVEEIERLKKIFDIAFDCFTMGSSNYARLDINVGDKFDVGTMQVKPGTQQSGNVKEIFFRGYKVVSSNVIRKQSLVILG